MINCPFCGEVFDEDNLVYQFRWGDIAGFYYRDRQLPSEPPSEYVNRPVYITMEYNRRGPALGSMNTVINPRLHTSQESDPMRGELNFWTRVEELLLKKNTFSVETDDDKSNIPVRALFLPLSERQNKYGTLGSGVSTGVFCPACEQQLKSEALQADKEIRILMIGRAGSGKTVYITQLITEMLQGSGLQGISIEGANSTVDEHYLYNRRRLQALGGGEFVQATGKTVQTPYVYLLKRGSERVRLVLQDIAGEDCQDKFKYKHAAEKADMLLFFIDPWHVPELRAYHESMQDASCEVVRWQTRNTYDDLNGIFHQMLDSMSDNDITKSNKLAGVMLIKGDYLNPPMLSAGTQPECVMMKSDVNFSKTRDMEFSIGMRSSFVRQCLNEWSSVREIVRSIESKFPARNTRYFVSTALGQSTHMQQIVTEDTEPMGDPEDQFGSTSGSGSTTSVKAQVLDTPARPEHIIDPIVWCMQRNGVDLWK